jgi:hypothetical protein
MMRVKDFAGKGMVTPGFTERQLDLEVDVVGIDPIAGSISIIYRITGDSCTGTNCSDVNIFTDPNLQISNTPSTSPVPSTDAPTSPVFRWSPLALTKPDDSYAIFKITSLVVSSDLEAPDFQKYPFDIYGAPISVFATEANISTPVGFSIVHTGGLVVCVSYPGCVVHFSSGSSRGYRITAEFLPGCDDSDVYPGKICKKIVISRGVLVKAYAIVIIIAVWVITLIFLFTICYSVVGGFPQRAELLVIPVATLFTVTQLRTTMPGAPSGFGAIIDYAALLPCLAMMTLCGSISITLLAFPGLFAGGCIFGVAPSESAIEKEETSHKD